MKLFKRVKIAFYFVVKGVDRMILAYILGIDLGIITFKQVPAQRQDEVRQYLIDAGQEDKIVEEENEIKEA